MPQVVKNHVRFERLDLGNKGLSYLLHVNIVGDGEGRVYTDLGPVSLDPIPAAKADMKDLVVFQEDVSRSITVMAIRVKNGKPIWKRKRKLEKWIFLKRPYRKNSDR